MAEIQGLSYIRSERPGLTTQITVGALLRSAATEVPDRTALVFYDGTQDPAPRWTYAQLLAAGEANARALLELFQPGERIAIWSANCPEWIFVEFGAALAGLTLVAISPAAADREVEYALGQSEANGVIFAREYKAADRAALLDDLRPGLPELRHAIPIDLWPQMVAAAAVERTLPEVDPGDVAIIQYTSGTTGSPKGAMLSHRAITSGTRCSEHAFAMKPGSIWLNPAPLYNVAGAVACTMNPIWNRGTQVFLPRFEAELALRAIAAERVNWTVLIGAMAIAAMEKQQVLQLDIKSLELVVQGGSPVAADMVHRVERELGAECGIVFGMTETAGTLCMSNRNDTVEHRTQTIGYPLGGVEIRICDPVTNELALPGVQGELQIRSHAVMNGYYKLPERTAEAIGEDGWLRSGDLGLINADGYVQITGRLKDMIIRGGSNIYPREVEEALAQHPDVSLCAVFGVPDDRYGEIVIAALKTHSGQDPDMAEMRAFLGPRLAPYKVPSVIYQVAEMPVSTVGKIQKFMLRDAYLAGQGA